MIDIKTKQNKQTNEQTNKQKTKITKSFEVTSAMSTRTFYFLIISINHVCSYKIISRYIIMPYSYSSCIIYTKIDINIKLVADEVLSYILEIKIVLFAQTL